MDESILNSAKAGRIDESDDAFNKELIIHINTFLAVLNQLGIGTKGFQISGENETWSDFIGDGVWIPECKTWLMLRVMQVFDTSASSTKEQVVSEKIDELTWRILTEAEYGSAT